MKIVHVNCDDGHTGGATIAAYRIHNALLIGGDQSLFVCRFKSSIDSIGLEFPSKGWQKKLLTYKCKILNTLVLGRACGINWLRTGMSTFINALNPDIVHLHWVKGDTISIEEIGEIRRPVVWSLHDLWPCLGVDSYPQNDWFKKGYNVDPKCKWMDRWIWHRKKQAFQRMNITLVGPSEWSAQQTRESLIFRNQEVECIHYPVDTQLFVPGNQKKACSKWGIPDNKFIVLYGAVMGTQWRIKGFDRLADSLGRLDDDMRRKIHIVVFGESAPTRLTSGVTTQFVGRVTSAAEMASLYPAADLFAFPSRQETFGQTKTESLSCGIPVLAFDQTACAEGIVHKENGWVAKCDDIEDFAAGLRWGFEVKNDQRKSDEVAKHARKLVVERYAPEVIAGQWKTLYADILNRKNKILPLGKV